MAQEKREYITVSSGSCVRRQDLLSAAERLLQQTTELVNERNDSSSQNAEIMQRKVTRTGPKRPSNAFMLYSSSLRKKIKTLFPEYSNSEISKLLGAMWHAASMDVKKKYTQKADEGRLRHKAQYPNYEYNVRKPSSPASETKNQEEICGSASAQASWIDQLNDILLSPPPLDEQFATCYVPSVHNEASMLPSGTQYIPSTTSSGMSMSTGYSYNHIINDVHHGPPPDDWNEICNAIAMLFPEFATQGSHPAESFSSVTGTLDSYL